VTEGTAGGGDMLPIHGMSSQRKTFTENDWLIGHVPETTGLL
jgi:hypothetical protein